MVAFKNVVASASDKAVTLEKVRPSFENLDVSWHEQRNRENSARQAKLKAKVEPAEAKPSMEEAPTAGNAESVKPGKTEESTSSSSKPVDGNATSQPTSTAVVSADSKETSEEAKKDSKEVKEPDKLAETEPSTTAPPVTYSRKGWLMPYEEP